MAYIPQQQASETVFYQRDATRADAASIQSGWIDMSVSWVWS